MEREGFSEEEITWQFAFRMALSVLAIGKRVFHVFQLNRLLKWFHIFQKNETCMLKSHSDILCQPVSIPVSCGVDRISLPLRCFLT
jgi:hypothetical protein